MSYGIDDSHGTSLAQGIERLSQARRVAQELADRYSEPVYVYRGQSAPEEIAPSPNSLLSQEDN